MFKIKVINYKNNNCVGSYSFKTKKEAIKAIDDICELHYLKKCGYDYINYNLSLQLEILF